VQQRKTRPAWPKTSRDRLIRPSDVNKKKQERSTKKDTLK